MSERNVRATLACAVFAILGTFFVPASVRADGGKSDVCRERWKPQGVIDWALDYSSKFAEGTLDLSHDAYILPLWVIEEAEKRAAAQSRPGAVQTLRVENKKRLICYTNCGAYEPENWNEQLLEPVRGRLLGKTMAGYPEEKWLNIKELDLLRPLVREKFALAARSGCDAMVCDNTEAWITGTDGDGSQTIGLFRSKGLDAVKQLAALKAVERTGNAITFDDQLRYNRMLAEEAHAQCLSIGLINDVFQINELAADFDFALNEQCHHCGWCDLYRPFVDAGKPVLHLEFEDNEGFCKPGSAPIEAICRDIASMGLTTFSTVKRAASSKLHTGDRPSSCRAP